MYPAVSLMVVHRVEDLLFHQANFLLLDSGEFDNPTGSILPCIALGGRKSSKAEFCEHMVPKSWMSSPKMQCGHSILSGELLVTVPAVEVSVSLQPSSPLLFCHYCFCLLRADALLFTRQFATLLWLAYQPLLVAMDEVGVLFTRLETMRQRHT